MKRPSIPKKLFISACMATGTTNAVARLTGVNYFLPQLFAMRFANMGGLDPDQFRQQLNGLRTFEATGWCAYWNAFAEKEEAAAQRALADAPEASNQAVQNAYVRAITYYSVSAWPGVTPLQLRAYERACELTERWFQSTAPNFSRVNLRIAGEAVAGYLYLPEPDGQYPMVVVTNGLEGTIQELAFPIMKYCDDQMGIFLMEMPGTYAYKHRMSVGSEAIYHGVIEYVAEHPRVDASRIAMVGISFGGYWSARMAAVSPRLCCAVTSGPPVEYAFQRSNSLGLPAVMVSVMNYVTGAKGAFDLLAKLRPLSFANGDLYKRVNIPLLIINGDTDTLVGTRDSIELNRRIPGSLLKLYESDDHCAMGHYREWLDLTFAWLKQQFANPQALTRGPA